MKDTWNPAQYNRFRAERSAPFFDLLALVRPRPAMRVVDLGCGTGELTRELHRRLAARETLGIDSSEKMLDQAREFAEPGLGFARADIADFASAQKFDLIFTNAALHWLPDHRALFARIVSYLQEDGQLAVQMPANHDHPSHTVAAEVAAEEPFRSALAGYARVPSVMAPEAYAELLDELGFGEQHVRLQVYNHHLERRDDVVEWVKGTLLTDYEKRLPPEVFARFLERYRARLLPLLSDRRPYFYPFNRVLIRAALCR